MALLLGCSNAPPARTPPSAAPPPAEAPAPSGAAPLPPAADTGPAPTSGAPSAPPPPLPPEPSCAAKDRPWPTALGHRRELEAFRAEPRDETWARAAEAHLTKSLEGADEALRILECRRSACLVGSVEDRAFAERLGAVVWSGPTSRMGLRGRDSCPELLTVFWRSGRDYPGAPGGRLSSMKKLQCAGSLPASAGASCPFRAGNLCFDGVEAACRCSCSVRPGASLTRPLCVGVAHSNAVNCSAPQPQFGMPWPPPRSGK